MEAIREGVKIIGEARVQEAIGKFHQIGRGGVEWHLVGHLQRNKAKRAVEIFDLIHSVDTASLASEIDRRARAIGKVQRILIQVNVSGESTKFGIPPSEVLSTILQIRELPNIKIQGLMTIAPLTKMEEKVRMCFRGLRELFDDIKRKSLDGIEMRYLSMGMTDDFEVAIEEGANMVRIGRAIFGERDVG
jgi:hypothetical protein